MSPRPSLLALAAAALLSACAAGPDYVRPTLPVPDAYKEAGGWKPADPRPAASGLAWWTAYGDPVLDGLEADAGQANQTVRQAEATYRQARALADADRAGLFPSLGIDAGAQRARTNTSGVKTGDGYTLGLAAGWEPDLWGSVRRTLEGGNASAQASGDDLAAARLSIQTTLAQDYLQLRVADQQRDLYATTVEAYAKSVKLTRAQHDAGVALQSDVSSAEAQLAQAQAAAVDLEATRAQLEHAIAVLTGRAPAQFALAAAPANQPLALKMPATPAGLPSALLEHRPDIAAAERRAAAANANIGVARAAYFPQLTLSASGGFSAAALGSLFDAPARVWSLGAALAQTIFDGGLRSARTAQAEAAYDAAVAQYKATVLDGFQQVEDQLALLRLLDQEATLQDQAVRSSQQAEQSALAQYRVGTLSYLNVVTAQALSLSNQRSALQLRGRLVAASISLVAATGGGWSATDSTAVAANPAQPQ
ncbi:MAG TPA: efflux transporter outer membrane subunit [Burkholderiaceae bacterium]|jgi:NodT family efflux transporter outer membrane factor (OMF) lipoprotein|nr:efflux transporter outer membrane subunit [Burkholderiaceae bacterium]